MTKFHCEECCEFGVAFALPKTLFEKLRNRKPGTEFYCPNCHAEYCIGESDAEMLRHEREKAKQRETIFEDEFR